MASKTRKSMGTPSLEQTASTSTPYGSSNLEKKGTPLSPARMTRMQEKFELQNLNGRLATYIERIRFLECENNRLSVQVRSSQETLKLEVNNIKAMYQNELKDARQTLDDTAKEKAQLQSDLSNLKLRFDEVNQRLTKKEKELASTEKQLNQVDAYSPDLQAKFNQFASEESYQSESSKSRIKDLEALLEQEREWNSLALQAKDEELKNLRHDVEKQLQEYQDLRDINVDLDMEIAAYRKLLEVEENRLHITPVRAMEAAQRCTPVQKTPIQSTKRKRTVHESDEKSSSNIQISQSAKSNVEIVDHDREANFIKIHNKGSTVAESNRMPINQELTKQATNVPINVKEMKEEFFRLFVTKRKISLKSKLSMIHYIRSKMKLETESEESDLEEHNCSSPQLNMSDIRMSSKKRRLFLRKRLNKLERKFLKEAELEKRRK